MSQFSYPQYQKQYSRCKKCFKLILDNTGLQEPICGAQYCPRCLCAIYQPHYLEPQKDIILELYCGHYVDRSAIENAIAEHCVNCGGKFDRRVDVEMKGGVKLCRGCFDHHSSKYSECLHECMSCNRIIRLIDFLAGTQVMLCKDCATQQSELQATTFSQSQATYKQEPPKHQPSNKQSPKSLRNVEQVPSPPAQKDKVAKKESQRSSSSRGEDDLPEDISIVSRFSALQVEQRQSGRSAEGEGAGMRKVKLTSKHSIDIRVENLKITVPPSRVKNGKPCQVCGSLVADGGLVQDAQNQLQCKVCYMQTYDPRQSGFYRSFARTSTANSRDKHTSAPKHKGLLGDALADNIREMKKSMMSGGKSEVSSPYPPKPSQHLAVSQAGKAPVWESLGKKERLCEICRAKDYKITRVDKKQVCQDCYYRH